MQNDFGGFGFIQFDGYERLMIFDGKWSESLENQIKKRQTSFITIDRWEDDKPLDFLIQFSEHIKGLRLKENGLKQVSFISKLTNLEDLYLWNNHANAIDFSNLRKLKRFSLQGKTVGPIQSNNLEVLLLEWINIKDLKNISTLEKLKELWVTESKVKALDGVENLKSLQKIVLEKLPVESLRGMEKLRSLQELWLNKLSIESLKGIEDLNGITNLSLENLSKIKDVHIISALTELRILIFDNIRIESLSFLKSLKKIEEIELGGRTDVLDGDLNPILTLPKLKKIHFVNRKHYTHTKKDIENHIGMKSS